MTEGNIPKLEKVLRSFSDLLCCAHRIDTNEALPSSAGSLSFFISESNSEEGCCSFPSFRLNNEVSASSLNMSLEEAAAFNLAIPMTFGKIDIAQMPMTILRNVSRSFMSLVESRLRSSLFALLEQSLKNNGGSYQETRILVELLSSSSPISMTTVVTTFRALNSNDNDADVVDQIVLPLVFEVIIDLNVLGKLITIPLRAPGSIIGSFCASDDGLRTVEVAFDTISFLQMMMKQARFLARQAVAIGSSVASSLAASGASSVPKNHLQGLSTHPVSDASSMPPPFQRGISMPPPPPRKPQNTPVREDSINANNKCDSDDTSETQCAPTPSRKSTSDPKIDQAADDSLSRRLPHKKRLITSCPDLGSSYSRQKVSSL